MWCGLSPRIRSRCDGEAGVEHERAEELGREEDVVVARASATWRSRCCTTGRAGRRRPPRRAPAPRRAAPAHRRSGGSPPGRPARARCAWPSAMPVSSTVWWPSTCRSPCASTVRSSRACRRQRLEHVVEEADPGVDRGLAAPVEVDPDVQVGLLGGAADLADARSRALLIVPQPRICSSAAAAASMSSGVPIEIRRQSASSGEPRHRARGCRGRREPAEHLPRGRALAAG